ncbi:hypothetical protein PALI_a3837 [Pseudoalteromonas aliena SW19]|uniref:Uncharacterized protein n=1 Tax=Pseudoalteromonas aliena SW19 TaxID=1314866 RepID=A0ABR9DUX6_9GAMM|nr:hypothetical protein [Pseudoalteromonas aliena SW19]
MAVCFAFIKKEIQMIELNLARSYSTNNKKTQMKELNLNEVK